MNKYPLRVDPQTQFLLSTSGSESSIKKHNDALQAFGINIAYFTFSREIDAETYVALLRTPIIRGGAVTGQGLKSAVLPLLSEVDDLVRQTGAVNTVINRQGRLCGYNTDAFGFETALHSHLEKSGVQVETAVIYGNGGVSGVAAHVLQKMKIKTTMTGRNQSRVVEKMQQTGLEPFEGPYDLVVNATPVTSDQLDYAEGLKAALQGCKIVFDHNMPEKDGGTNYLEEYCHEYGLHFIPGKDMYTAQMIKQWRLFLDGYTDTSGNTWDISDEDIKKCWAL